MPVRKLKLFCFPFAGGSASVFFKWRQLVDPIIELVPVELAGRGRRITEPLYKNLDDLTTDLLKQIRPELEQGPYAFFGHSMGGLIVYVLTKAIQLAHLALPQQVFISGKGAPHILRPDKEKYHTLPTPVFISEVMKLGGTPAIVFEDAELREFFLPMLRNDFKIAETDIESSSIIPINTPINLITGKEEDLIPEQIQAWEHYTSQAFKTYTFDGGHFYIHDHTEALLNLMVHRLQNYTSH